MRSSAIVVLASVSVTALLLAVAPVAATEGDSAALDDVIMSAEVFVRDPVTGLVPAPLGVVEFLDPDTLELVAGRGVEPDGYVEVLVPPGDYLVLGSNFDDGLFWDYFPELWEDTPALLVGKASVVSVPPDPPVRIVFELEPMFLDMWDTPFSDDIFFLRNAGITRGCNPAGGNTLFCPEDEVTRGQMAAFLVRALGLPSAPSAGFVDTTGNVFEGDIDRLAAVGITRGCNPNQGNTRYCPTDPVTRGQMAAFMVRAFGLPPAAPSGFVDTAGSVFEGDIDRLAAVGITRGCNPNQGNTRYCPTDPVTRGQMAAFVNRAFGWAVSVAPRTAGFAPADGTAPSLTPTDVLRGRGVGVTAR